MHYKDLGMRLILTKIPIHIHTEFMFYKFGFNLLILLSDQN